jgi:hypothetical protein
MIIRYLLILLFYSVNVNNIYAAIDYSMELSNGIFVDNKTYEFEVYVRANQDNFTLNAYQCAFLFNKSITNNGILSFEFVGGTCELSNKPEFGIGISGAFWLPTLTFASNAGQDIIQTDYKRIGKFRIKNSNTFGGKLPAIKWQFGSFYSTIVSGDNFKDITNPTFHTYDNIGYPLYISRGWNFVSIPLKLKDMSVKSIFPNAVSSTFTLINGRYEIEDTIQVGKAYWIEFNQESLVEIKGEAVEFPIFLYKGWNSIGIFHYNVPTAIITTNPLSIISAFFGINNSQYYSTNLLEPGKGYQIYSEENGFMFINSFKYN